MIADLLLIIPWIIQTAALVAAVYFWKSYKHTTQRYFLWFMIYVVCHEITGYFFIKILKSSNDFIYNIYTLISFGFYFYWFHLILRSKKWLVYCLTFIFLSFFCFDIITKNFTTYLYTYPIIVGAIAILILTTSYFIELISDDRVVNFIKAQRFWIVAGLLFFYIGLIPLLLFHEYLDYSSNQYGFIISSLNLVLYGCFIKGFLCLKMSK